MEQTNEMKTYPVQTSDGFYYEDDTDEGFKIETKVHENGNKVKRITLSDNRVCVARELKGSDMEKADRMHGNDQSKVITAMMSLAVKINDQPVVMEDLRELKARDYNAIKIAVSHLNF